MQVEGIYTAEPRFEAKAKALKLKQEMAAAAEEGRKRLRGMPGLDLVETPKPLERQIRAEVEARVPEKVWKPKTIRTFEEEPRKKVLPDFSNLKDVTGYGPDGGGSGRSGSIDIPSFWESTGQAAVGGATRSLGTQMDVWGTQYQRWQPARSQMNAEQSNWYQEQYQSELRTYYSMLDENRDKPGTYSWAALENQKRILDEAGQRAGIFQKIDQYQKQAGEATRDLAQDTYVKGQSIVDQAANGRGARGQKWADFVANGTELLINSVIDKTLGPEAALLYRMGNRYGAATMRAYANGKTLEQQHLAGMLSASGTAAGSAVSSAMSPMTTNVLQRNGWMHSTVANAVESGVRAAGYSLGDTAMQEISEAVTYPDSYQFDVKNAASNAVSSFAFAAVHQLIDSARVSKDNKKWLKEEFEQINESYRAAKENTGGQAQIDAAQKCLAQIEQFNGTLSQRRILGADAEVRNVYAGLQGIQQEMYDILSEASRKTVVTVPVGGYQGTAAITDRELTEKEFDAHFERGFNYEEDENLKFIENDAKMKAESGLPKKVNVANEYLPYTLGPVGEEFKGVVPYGVELTNVYIMAGEGTSTPLRDVKRLYFTYPEYGDAAGWTKKSGTAYGKHFHYVIHWYENSGISPEESFKLKGKK